MSAENGQGRQPVEKRVSRILEETRVVLPGVGAVWGFQAVATFSESFSRLPETLQYAHLGGIAATTLSFFSFARTPAFDRNAENGEATERLSEVGDKSVKRGMFLLSAGMSVDLGVIAYQTTQSPTVSAVIGVGAFAYSQYNWFLEPYFKRNRG